MKIILIIVGFVINGKKPFSLGFQVHKYYKLYKIIIKVFLMKMQFVVQFICILTLKIIKEYILEIQIIIN